MRRMLVLVAFFMHAAMAQEISHAALATSVYRIFERSCAECHDDGRTRNPKAFGSILRLDELSSNPDYVLPGEPDDSEIVLCLSGDGWAEQMPPPDSDAPPVSAEERALIAAWVAGGAGDAGLRPDQMAAPPPTIAPSDIESEAFNGYRLIGKLHPVMVHFPIALLLIAALAEIFVLMGVHSLMPVVRFNLWVAVLGSIPSLITGLIAVPVRGYGPETVFLHKWLGIGTAFIALLALIAYEVALRKDCRIARAGMRVALFLSALLIGIVGYTGGEIVYGVGHLW
ncbi:MAG: DUF2231 domain-containing protein [Planctomycetota bacterium]